MSRHFRNPLRMLLPKGSDLSPKHISSLNTFEETLVGRIDKLSPANQQGALKISWIRCAMEELRGVHADFRTLIGALELPISEWKGQWAQLYFDNSAKLLEICNSFTVQIRELEQSRVYLGSALHHLDGSNPDTFVSSRSSLDKWRQRVSSRGPTVELCLSAIDDLSQTFDLPSANNSDKERVLVRAMHGVKAMTLFVCGVFAASFSGSANALRDLQVPNACMWAQAFLNLQSRVNSEMRRLFSSGKVIVYKELQAVDLGVEELHRIVREGAEPVRAEIFDNLTSEIRRSSEEYSRELALLLKEVDKFFQVIVSERNVLMG